MFSLRKLFKKKAPPVQFVFDEKYRIPDEDMLKLIEDVSDSKFWDKQMRKDTDPLIASIQMSRMNGAMVDNDRLHVGYCYHAVGATTAYLIRDKKEDKILFSAAKYHEDISHLGVRVHTFHPGDWIEMISKFAGEEK